MWFYLDTIPTLCGVVCLPFWSEEHRKQDAEKGKAQLRLTTVFAEVLSSLLLLGSHQMSFIRLIPPSLAWSQLFGALAHSPSLALYAGARESGALPVSVKVQMWVTEHLLCVYLDFLRHIYSSLLPTPFQVRIFRSFLRIFIASYILRPEAGAGLGILSTWSLYQNLLSFYWSSLFKVYDFPYFFLLMENLG